MPQYTPIRGSFLPDNPSHYSDFVAIGYSEKDQVATSCKQPFSTLFFDIENLIYCHCGNEDDTAKDFPALLRGNVYQRTLAEEQNYLHLL